MSYIEKINLKIANYNKAQQDVLKRIREENTKLPEDFIEMLVNLNINKNITLFAVDILSFNLELNDTIPETEDELRDIRMAKERAKLFMDMILLSKKLYVYIPDFTLNDPWDAKRLVVLMKQYPNVSWLRLLVG